MSINKLISVQEPIVDAMELCGTENDKDRMVFTRWAYQAEKEIGSRFSYIKKIAVVDIKGCVAHLPSDAAYLQRALLGDYGCDCTDLFYKWCSTLGNQGAFASPAGPTFLIVDAGSSNVSMWQNIVACEIQDNKIVLMNNHDGQKLTIQYVAFKTDCDGFLEISENHVLAIRNYICMNYYLRRKRLAGEDYFKFKEYKAEYHRECGNARAQDSIPTEGERQVMVNMLHDPYIGIGIPTSFASQYGGWGW